MSKLFSGTQIIKALQKLDFYVASTKGSHVKLRGIRFKKTVTVIVPKHKEVAMGTLASILRQANVEYKELKKLIK